MRTAFSRLNFINKKTMQYAIVSTKEKVLQNSSESEINQKKSETSQIQSGLFKSAPVVINQNTNDQESTAKKNFDDDIACSQ